MPSASATEGSRRSGSRTDASGTHHTPSGKASAAPATACSARRVLPTPPGPVRVSRRIPRSTSAPSRPARGHGQRRLSLAPEVRPIEALQCGELAAAELEDALQGAPRSLNRCSPRSVSAKARLRPPSPPRRALGRRAHGGDASGAVDIVADIPSSPSKGVPVWTPTRTRTCPFAAR